MGDPAITPEWIRARRKAADLTQQELADRLGYSIELIRKVEQGKSAVSARLTARLAQVLAGPAPAGIAAPAPPAFGPWVAGRRKALGLTQEQLAAEVGCAMITVRKLEAGQLRPSDSLAGALAGALAVPDSAQPGFIRWARGLAGGVAGPPPPLAPRTPQIQTNLPVPPASLLGRQAEVAALIDLLRRPAVRLVTLTGPGGVGKTRLALEVAAEVRPAFPDGVWFVDLAPVQDPALVAPTIAGALALPETAGRAVLAQLKDYLRPRTLLLVLDNLEHLLAAADLISALLAGAQGLRVLSTSRARLDLATEHEYPVPPLTLADQFPDGVLSVALPAHTDLERAVAAVSRVVGAPETAGRSPLDSLLTYLHPQQALLVLETPARLPAGAAAAPFALARTLHAAAPGVAILLTDHVILWTPGAAPPRLAAHPAVALFLRRAEAVDPGFPRSEATLLAVAAIAARVDGLPLALALAAGRSKQLPPAVLLGRLADRLGVLTGGARDLPARHQTLRALLDWSYDLLGAAARRLFTRCAQFAGGWTLDAVAQVCADPGDTPAALEAHLWDLVNSSLVHPTTDGDGARRFVLLETIREYAAARLAADPAAAVVAARHATYFRDLVARAGSELRGPHQVAAIQTLLREQDNLRAALTWSLTAGAPEVAGEIAAAAWPFWRIRGYWSEGRHWLTAVRAQAAAWPAPLQATLLAAEGALISDSGDLAPAEARLRESLALRRAAGDATGTAEVLNHLSTIARRQGRQAAALAELQESLDLYRGAGDRRGVAETLFLLGALARAGDDLPRARAYFEESLALFRALDDAVGVARLLMNLGTILPELEGPRAALPLLEESCALYQQLGDREALANALTAQGNVFRLAGDLAGTEQLYAEAYQLRVDLGAPLGIAVARFNRALIAAEAGRPADAIPLYQESLADFRTAGQIVFEGTVLLSLGDAARAHGDWTAARSWYEQGLALSERHHLRSDGAGACYGLGRVAQQAGAWPAAAARYQAALATYREIGDEIGQIRVLLALAALAADQGDAMTQARLLGTVDATLPRLGARLRPGDRQLYEQGQARLADGDPDPAVMAAHAEGRQTALAAVVSALASAEAGT